MNAKKIKLLFSIFLILLINVFDTFSEDLFFFPKTKEPLNINWNIGLSLTFLPIAVVEEEINSSPMINAGFRIDLGKRFSSKIDFGSNYIANIGSLGFYYNILENDITFGLGLHSSIWFGHLDFSSFKIKSTGGIISPEIHAGIEIGKIKLSFSGEVESNYLYTTSDEVYLGETFDKFSGFTIKFVIEQPLWNDNWVTTSIKLNYNKFYYQSWLSFSTVDEYLLYPEFSFGFNL